MDEWVSGCAIYLQWLSKCSCMQDFTDALCGMVWCGFTVECVDTYKGHN